MTAKPPTAKPALVVHDETPERLVLTWRASLLGRMISIGFCLFSVASMLFVITAIHGVGQRIFMLALCAVIVGATIAAWFFRGYVEMSATRLIAIRHFGVTRKVFDQLREDIAKFDVDLTTISNGRSASVQWQVRAILANKQRMRLSLMPSEDVARYVCEQLTRRLAIVDTSSAMPYR
ncbi:MAG TPA: hypothetical protein VGM90_16555 [Kofleriaceae bacterium]|jgi:hypothetical protein